MTDFAEFMNDILSLRKRVALFRKVTLHAHSPESWDWNTGDVSNVPVIEGWSPEESAFIEGIKSSGLDLMALTDHMKCCLACRISSELSLPTHVLPGMEVSIRPKPPLNHFRLHILIVYPEGFSVDKVCKIIPNTLPDEASRTGKEEIPDVDLEKLIDEVHRSSGMCIAAHVDNEAGMRRAFRQVGHSAIALYDPDTDITDDNKRRVSAEFKDWILAVGFDAIQVGKEKDKEHYRWVGDACGKTFNIPALLSTDAHRVEDLAAEDKVTHLKMTSVDFDGLKRALLLSDTRIRFPGELPKTPTPRIMGIQIASGGSKGFFTDLKLAFSDNLTCLIGPRGSGKSTVIEALRYLFGYNRTLQDIDAGKELATKVRQLQQATLEECLIRVVYENTSGEQHILEATYDPKTDYGTRVYTLDGEEKDIHDVERCGLYPLRLFGWSEIETLGREPHRQRELLDRLVPGLSEKKEERKKKRGELHSKAGKIRATVEQLNRIMERNQGEIRRYREYKSEFEKLNTDEVKVLFSELDALRKKTALLEKLKTNVEGLSTRIAGILEFKLLEGTGDAVLGDEDLTKWWKEATEELGIRSKRDDIRSHLHQVKGLLEGLTEEVETKKSQLNSQIREKEQAVRASISDETAKQVDANLRETARKHLARVEGLKREYEEALSSLSNHMQEWRNLCDELCNLQNSITGMRTTRKDEIEQRLGRFGTDKMQININFFPGQDRLLLKDYLDKKLLTRTLHGNFRQKSWPERFAAVLNPVELALAIADQKPEDIVKSMRIEGQDVDVDEDMANRLTETMYPFARDENADIQTVISEKLQRVLELAEIDWDDKEYITLNQKPVERLSPGQRSSAMLPLIALSEEAPLVIDQPEDNLDNRLVGDVLVDILAELKEKRQIIVATHNPNIVVGGDSEQVIVLDALSESKGECKTHGSIDNDDIVEAVIEIMEGGYEAFLTRKRRYGL